MMIGKLTNNKIVEIVRVAETVRFSEERGWLLLSSEINKKNSLSVKWVKASETQFIWVREFRL